ncbi:MAG: phosphoribosylformylglycinamidine cyclo-ligase (AIRS) [candidate division NC10 bacterium CSP1-5]|nr:MAG: phosphoribosylformylglycinamidine cyclo-ligase (AIRS) [candidate division NC10 bacterium CSP1-5]
MGRSKQAPYARAGVDADRAGSALKDLTALLRETFAFRKAIGRVMLPFGYFANVIALGENLGLALSTDGVGTKILVAQMLGRFDTIGIDCVAMNVNDLLCVGAEPLALVDYVAVQSPNRRMFREIGKGLYEGARRARITIPGGEVAQLREMIRGVHGDDGCDLVGTCVGIVPLDRIIIGQRIKPKDVVLGLRSSGIHSNGLTLARDVFFRRRKLRPDRHMPELGRTIGDELLEPTRIYVPEVVEMLRGELDLKALIHMTGDGLLNLSRVAAPVGFVIDFWPEPHPVFGLIQAMGRIGPEEMFRIFNMGIGFCLVLPDDSRQIDRVMAIAKRHGVECYRLGYAIRDAEQRISLKPYDLVAHGGRFRRGSRFRIQGSGRVLRRRSL